jgi:hypothetical protein
MDSPATLFNKPRLAPRPPLVAAQAMEAVLSKHGPRRNVSSACSACKAKRKKCDGNQPCSTCMRLGAHCHYDAAHDGRRDLKRKLVAFEKDSQCLHQLLDLIKGDNDHRAAHLITLIRKTSSVEEIEALIEEQRDIESKDGASAKFPKEDGNDYRMSTSTSESTPPSLISMRFAGSEQPPMEGEPRVPASSLATDSTSPTPSLMLHESGIVPLSNDVFSAGESSTNTAKPSAVQHRLSSNSTDTNVTSDSPTQQGSLRLSRSRADLGQGGSFPLNVPLRNHSNLLVQGSLTWHPALKYNAEFFRHPSLSHLVPSAPLATGTLRISGFPLTIEEQQLEILHKPEWSILPLAFDDGSTLCRACTSFLSAARVMIEQGTSISAILGEDRPQVDFFFAPRRLGSPEEISVSHWACSLFSSFKDLERSFALIWVLLAYRLMRVIYPFSCFTSEEEI